MTATPPPPTCRYCGHDTEHGDRVCGPCRAQPTIPPPLPEVETFAERIRAAIPDSDDWWGWSRSRADRRRVDRDMEGLREHRPDFFPDLTGRPLGTTRCARCDPEDLPRIDYPCPDARRYWDGLRDTGTLYGEEP